MAGGGSGIGGGSSSRKGGGGNGVGGGIGRHGERVVLTSTNYFTDKLPAELRIKIYGYVFGPSEHARLVASPVIAQTKKICPIHRFATVPVRTQCCHVTACHGCIADDGHQCPRCREPVLIDLMDLRSTFTSGEERTDVERLMLKRRQKRRTLIPTSILAVNKKIYGEALETFYDNKIIQVTFHQLSLMLDFRKMRSSTQINMAKNIQMVKIADRHHRDELVQDALDGALELPRLNSVTIIVHSLTKMEADDAEIHDVVVRSWSDSMGLGMVLEGKIEKVHFESKDGKRFVAL